MEQDNQNRYRHIEWLSLLPEADDCWKEHAEVEAQDPSNAVVSVDLEKLSEPDMVIAIGLGLSMNDVEYEQQSKEYEC